MSHDVSQNQYQKVIITQIKDRIQFAKLLENNIGLIIIKLGASWCGPCKKIKPVVDGFFASSPTNVTCCDIDIDECFDVYSFLKSKKMVNGVPTMLCYKMGNHRFIPDASTSGSDPVALDSFFKQCGAHLKSIKTTKYAK
jgi:thioredoxin 1